MGITCNGICIRYKASKESFSSGRYRLGQKRCNSCELFLYWDGPFCPCCNYRLRVKPRHTKSKKKTIVQKAAPTKATIGEIYGM
ncbi:MAG: hypothetical protein OEL69_03195 [Nitrosopumilus sp.]|nr:hypothetical protein [Nitrosopumilus sp.]